jgi:hypothetical protein
LTFAKQDPQLDAALGVVLCFARVLRE